MIKRAFTLALFPVLIAGLISCGGSSNGGPTGSGSGTDGGTPVGDGDSTPPATDNPTNRPPQTGGNFLQQFPLNQIVSGGVAKDGIPALTDPVFTIVSDATYLGDNDLVLGVVINGEAKAYPHNVGWWHEIVNDVVGGVPVVVSLCPLTSTGMVFNGQGTDGSRITCGVSGLLFNNNLIMYDRRDGNTLYPQMIYAGVDGPGAGEELQLLPVIETTWRYWKQLYPDSHVIDVGTNSLYRQYPYGSYRTPQAPPMFATFPSLTDNQTSQLFSPKDMTLGVRFGETAKAYPFPSMGEEAVINDELDGQSVLVVFYGREQLAIPYSRLLGTRLLTFEKTPSTDPVYPFMLKDQETGTTWNLKGEAVSGELSGGKLDQIPGHNAFWFAWSTFWQNTGIY